jgi:(5-formylfuran-3-yl)methyl phosphate synthase
VQLLVSVRDASEAAMAVAGQADIVDAKEPAQGALGPVSAPVLAAIRSAVPRSIPLSAALGDIGSGADLVQALDLVQVELSFVKFGFAGVDDPRLLQGLLTEAVGMAGTRPGSPAVIAVAYADWRTTGGLPPELFPALADAAGAKGLLLDTACKDQALGALITPAELGALGAELAARGLGYALGGSLTVADLPLAAAAGAGIVGVRGAVCIGGRTGRVSVERVAALARAVDGARLLRSASVQVRAMRTAVDSNVSPPVPRSPPPAGRSPPPPG